jgi:hypothetical protein
MSTDGSGGGIAGPGSVYSTATSASQRTASSNWWTSNTWGGGSGQKAVRGALQGALKLQKLTIAAQGLAGREQSAMHDFEARSGGAPGDVYEFNPDPKVQKIAAAVRQVQGLIATAKNARQAKKFQKKEEKLVAKMTRRNLKTADQIEINVGAEFGANAGYWREHGAPAPAWLSQRGVY